jgi:hypothetical protein
MADLTPHQEKVLSTYLQTMDKSATARALGMSRSAVRFAINAIEKKGKAPWLTPAVTPEHLGLLKTTVQYDRHGVAIQEWKRLVPELANMQEFVDGLCERVAGKARVKTRAARKTDRADVLGEMDVYDSHIGMYAHGAETNDQDYDSDIAVKRMVDTAEALASRYDRPHRMIVTFGGDILHSDTRNNMTEKSRNVLDVDSRYHRGVDHAIQACYDVVQIAAAISPQVDVVVLEGNHDWHSCVWLAQVLRAFYAKCPNINVVNQSSDRKHLVYGNNLLVWSHGDGVAMNQWPQIIAAEFAAQWGLTKFRHLKMGHVHHKKKNQPARVIVENKNGWEEHRGLLVEYLPALCASDAWHANAGYIGSMKGASGYEYHKTDGLMTRFYQHV